MHGHLILQTQLYMRLFSRLPDHSNGNFKYKCHKMWPEIALIDTFMYVPLYFVSHIDVLNKSVIPISYHDRVYIYCL